MKRTTSRRCFTSIASIAIAFALSSPAGAADGPTPLPVPEPTVPSPASPDAIAETATLSTTNLSLSVIKSNGAAAIAKRQLTLSALTSQLATQSKDCGTNATLQAELARTSTSLTTLGAALAATVDISAARALYRQIFVEHRVYALTAPKTGLVIRCTTQLKRNDALTAEAQRLQTLIDKSKAKGVDVTVAQVAKDSAVATLSSVNPAPSIQTVINLVPDRGDKASLAANNAALKAANEQLNSTLLQQRTVNTQLDAVRVALRQNRK
jgi:hypothetical protein